MGSIKADGWQARLVHGLYFANLWSRVKKKINSFTKLNHTFFSELNITVRLIKANKQRKHFFYRILTWHFTDSEWKEVFKKQANQRRRAESRLTWGLKCWRVKGGFVVMTNSQTPSALPQGEVSPILFLKHSISMNFCFTWKPVFACIIFLYELCFVVLVDKYHLCNWQFFLHTLQWILKSLLIMKFCITYKNVK